MQCGPRYIQKSKIGGKKFCVIKSTDILPVYRHIIDNITRNSNINDDNNSKNSNDNNFVDTSESTHFTVILAKSTFALPLGA